MIDFPKTSFFGKRIPKQKFYDNLPVSPELKRCFIDQISAIIWMNKISSDTVNIAAGERVSELEVFEIHLNQPSLSKEVLQLIDRGIPYHILFLLTYDGKEQAWIGYKESSQSGNNAFKVLSYYHTDWYESEQSPLHFEGLTTDAVYENFVYQIAGEALQSKSASLQDAVAREEKIKKLKKQIDGLQAKIRNEKQLNVQMKLNKEIRKLKSEMEAL